jgi:SpoVK/Ycf46/Vps4 family AAA+-type ATPase
MISDANKLRYEPILRLGREEAKRQLLLGGTAAAHAIYSIALHDPDASFAEEACLAALSSDDADLRYAAVGAIGEMTVYAGRNIDFGSVEAKLLELRNLHPELTARIQDALDDFEFALNRNLDAEGAGR